MNIGKQHFDIGEHGEEAIYVRRTREQDREQVPHLERPSNCLQNHIIYIFNYKKVFFWRKIDLSSYNFRAEGS